MKFQLVFASFLVCSLLVELFGEVVTVEDTTEAILDNTNPVPERRVATYQYNSGCSNDFDCNNILYSRMRYPATSSKFIVQKSRMPNGNVQFPRYREDNYINSPAYSTNNYPGSTGYMYPRRPLRFQSNSNVRPGSYGRDPRCSYKVVQNPGFDGQHFENIPRRNNGARMENDFLQYLLHDKRARQEFRRMLTMDDPEEEGQIEVVQE